jgi:uncharacterized phage protein gp47/JayE
MANTIDATGLHLKTLSEVLAELTAAWQTIYGPNVNLDPDTPDGQFLNIMAQIVVDNLELMNQVYNSFDPDLAIGTALDERAAINGLQRKAGTNTITDITITIDRAVTLTGIDNDPLNPFTVADNAGVQWQLRETQTPSIAGAYVYEFQAAEIGATQTTPNTITTPVTVVVGVTAINNPTTYTTLGTDEETDAALRLRRQRSTALGSQGYLESLYAALSNIDGVTAVEIFENVGSTTDADGIPGHSIWVIVAGGTDEEIANAIYVKRNAGCGMKGTTTFAVTQIDGSSFVVRWDYVTPQNLFIKFTATSLDGINSPAIALIQSELPTTFLPGVSAQVNINELGTLVQAIDPNTLLTNAGFSTTAGGAYTTTLTPSTKDKQFIVSSANIIILPMIMTPSSWTLAVTESKQFAVVGGYSTITWTLNVNNSGGSISPAGLYTAGATPTVSDTVRATDALGNFVDAVVTVT